MNTLRRCAHVNRYAAWPERLRRRSDTARAVIARLTGNAQQTAPIASARDTARGFAAVSRILRRSAGSSFHALQLLQLHLNARWHIAAANASRAGLKRFAPVARGAILHGTTHERHAMLERIVQWHRMTSAEHRSEHTDTQRTVLREVAARAAFPPVTQTVMRAAGAASARETAMAAPSMQQAHDILAAAAEAARARSSEPVALAQQELSRVTDHVIQQLDRRVLSFRERHGLL